MSKYKSSDSESEENGSASSSEEVETPQIGQTQRLSGYERERLKRIEENKARMEAMGLHKMASSLMGSVRTSNKKNEAKGKRKVIDEDEEYKPEGETIDSSSEDDDYNDSGCRGSSGSRLKKEKKKNSTPRKKAPAKNVSSKSDIVDDDDALMQAIALSLQDSAVSLDADKHGPSKSSRTHDKSHIKEDTSKRKRKKKTSSQVQMTEDELILHFFQFDEVGQGSIMLKDLRRVVAAHDFIWSDKEMADMVHFFDSDGDGKLSLDDFRVIVGRCNMI